MTSRHRTERRHLRSMLRFFFPQRGPQRHVAAVTLAEPSDAVTRFVYDAVVGSDEGRQLLSEIREISDRLEGVNDRLEEANRPLIDAISRLKVKAQTI